MRLSIDTFQILMSCAAFIVSTCLYWMLNPTIFVDVFYLVLFCIHVCVDDIKNKKTLGSSDQEASSSAAKNNMVVLVPCLCMELCHCSYFWWCEYFWGPRVLFITTEEFSVKITKTTSRVGVSWTHSLPFCFLPILLWV